MQVKPHGDTRVDDAAETVLPICGEAFDLAGFERLYGLVFLEHGTRRLHTTGVTTPVGLCVPKTASAQVKQHGNTRG